MLPASTTLVTCQFSGTCLQNFVEFDILFSLQHSQLWKQISRVLFRFCSAYIYSFERFFSQLSNDVDPEKFVPGYNKLKNVRKDSLFTTNNNPGAPA
jgi:hypothetical protein